MGKVEIDIFCYLHETVDILKKVLQKCSLSSPLWSIWILSKLLNLIGCHDNRKDKFAKIYSKNISSEAIRRMKLKLCRHVCNISLYKNCVFIAIAHVLSVLWQLKHILTYNDKSDNRKAIFVATERLYLWKNIKKNHLLRSHKGGWSWNFAEMLIALASKNYVFYCRCSCAFLTTCMTTLSFHWLVMGSVKVGLYCFLIADILTKVLQRCSLRSPLSNIWILSKPLNLIGCHDNRKDKFAKIYSKSISSEAIMRMKLKLCRHVCNISLYKNCVFIAIAHVLSVLWQLKHILTYNDKSESRSLLLSHCRYFDKTFL